MGIAATGTIGYTVSQWCSPGEEFDELFRQEKLVTIAGSDTYL
jgi:hypothetical protein